MKIDKVLLATIIIIIALVVVLATHMSTQNAFIFTPPQIISNNLTAPPSFVYNITEDQTPIYYIPPDMAWIDAHDYICYPILVDNGYGNVTFLLIGSMYSQQDHPECTSVRYYYMANASVFYSVFPTKDSSSDILGPSIIRHILITDNISSDNRNLSIKITPLPDGSGLVNITVRTSEGTYVINGSIQNPLDIQPQPMGMVGIGYLVDNGTIQYNNQSLKLTTIIARNGTFYVSDRELY